MEGNYFMPTLLTVVGIVLTVITLPLILELLAVTGLFLLPSRRRSTATGPVPRLTVVIPAHNEENLIHACVESLLRSAQGAARVLVVAHNCSDATAERAVAAGAELMVYNDVEARGKGQALRHAFRDVLTEGAEAVLVVDADSVVTVNLIPQVLQELSEGAAAVQCRYEMLSADRSARGRLASLAFRAFCYIRSAGRDRLGLSAGISGNGFALSARLLDRVPYDAFSVVEDLEYHLHTVMAGESVRFIESAIVTSYLPVSSSGGVNQQSRWQGGRLWAARKYLPSLLRRIARGQFRLIEPTLDLAGLPLAFAAAALLVESFIPLHWVHAYVAAALCVIAAHVMAAAWAGPDRWGTVKLLARTPFYILWKLASVPKLLKNSSGRAAWIRTDRGTPIAAHMAGIPPEGTS